MTKVHHLIYVQLIVCWFNIRIHPTVSVLEDTLIVFNNPQQQPIIIISRFKCKYKAHNDVAKCTSKQQMQISRTANMMTCTNESSISIEVTQQYFRTPKCMKTSIPYTYLKKLHSVFTDQNFITDRHKREIQKLYDQSPVIIRSRTASQ